MTLIVKLDCFPLSVLKYIFKMFSIICLKCTSSFSARMKLISVFVLCIMISSLIACEVFQWRSHTLHCCANGTGFKVGNQWVWSKEKPMICVEAKLDESEDVVPVLLIVTVIVASVFCCCQCVYCCLSCIFCSSYCWGH